MNILKSNLPIDEVVVNISTNLGGMKRIAKTERQQWIEQVNELVESAPDGYTAKLFLFNDRRQGAQIVIEREQSEGATTDDAPDATCQNDNRAEWDRALDLLFLTKEELGNG